MEEEKNEQKEMTFEQWEARYAGHLSGSIDASLRVGDRPKSRAPLWEMEEDLGATKDARATIKMKKHLSKLVEE